MRVPGAARGVVVSAPGSEVAVGNRDRVGMTLGKGGDEGLGAGPWAPRAAVILSAADLGDEQRNRDAADRGADEKLASIHLELPCSPAGTGTGNRTWAIPRRAPE